jgi:hypothetical protein
VRYFCSQAAKPVGPCPDHAETPKPSSDKKNFNAGHRLAIAAPGLGTPLVRSRRGVAQSLGWFLFLCLAAGTLLSGLPGCNARNVSASSATGNSPSTPTDPPSPNPPSDPPSSPPPNPPASPPADPPANPPSPTPEPIITLPTEQASSAVSFVGSVGVVTHLSYTDTPYYTEFPKILSALESLGVHYIRDGYYPWPASSPIVQAHQQLGAAGIKCDYVVPYVLSTTPEAIQQFAPMVRDMDSLEAPNECDISGQCNGTGAGAVDNVVAFLPTVHAAGKALGVPVLGPSFTQQDSYSVAGNLDSEMTVNNLHIYFGGRNPGSNGWGAEDAEGNSYGSFNWWLNQAAIDGPGARSEITETGYVASSATTTPFTLPENVEASYTPRTLLLAYMHGFEKTFLYELIDEVSSPGYGLLNGDLSPKPAFTALKNLLSTLSDSGPAFTPGALPYLISGGDSNLNHLLLEKSDGSYWLVLWLEEPSWNPVNVTPIKVTPENIGLKLNGAYATTMGYQFDSNGNVTANNLTMNGYSASLTISDQITIVEIHPN